jgi:hypothetical protein
LSRQWRRQSGECVQLGIYRWHYHIDAFAETQIQQKWTEFRKRTFWSGEGSVRYSAGCAQLGNHINCQYSQIDPEGAGVAAETLEKRHPTTR